MPDAKLRSGGGGGAITIDIIRAVTNQMSLLLK